MFNKKYWVLGGMIFAAMVFVFHLVTNPASELKVNNVEEIHVYSIAVRPSLFDIGYKEEDLRTPTGFNPEHNGVFSDSAAEKITASLKESARSYYTFTKPSEEGKLYSINFKLSNKVLYTFITQNLEEENQGKFWGYRSSGESINVKDIKWFVYHNPKLGAVLKDLRD